MPRKFEGYEPDAIDCDTQVRALAEDFMCVSTQSVEFALDTVVVVTRVYKVADYPNGQVAVQSRLSRPLKSRPQLYTMLFAGLQDCWHQLDRGVLGAKPPAVSHDYHGRPNIARRPGK